MRAIPTRPGEGRGRSRPRVQLIVLACLAITLGACSSDDDASSPTTTAFSTSTTTATADCEPTADSVVRSERRHLTFGDDEREYQLSLPAGYDGTTATPVILNLHGLTSTIEEQELVSNLPEAGGARGYAVVTPEALPATLPIPGLEGTNFWNIVPLFTPPTEPGSDSPGTTATIEGAGDDLGFLNAVLDDVEGLICVDTTREFVTGISNGAGMTMALVCTSNDRFAAAAPVAGANMGTVCPATNPTSIIAFHGDADPLVPYEGGDMFGYPLGLASVEDRVTSAAELAGCEPTPTETAPSDDSRRLVWSCPDDYGVELYTIIGGGHTWPGVTTYADPTGSRPTSGGAENSPYSIEEIVGHQTTNVIATDLMLDFFDDHPRRAPN